MLKLDAGQAESTVWDAAFIFDIKSIHGTTKDQISGSMWSIVHAKWTKTKVALVIQTSQNPKVYCVTCAWNN